MKYYKPVVVLAAFLCCYVFVQAQKKYISVNGNVTIKGTGKPVDGELVVVKGSEWKDTVLTKRIRNDGKFDITLPDSLTVYQLFFTKKGYTNGHVQVYPELGNYHFNIQLLEGAPFLNDDVRLIEWSGPHAVYQQVAHNAFYHVQNFEKKMVTVLSLRAGAGIEIDTSQFTGVDIDAELSFIEKKLINETDTLLREILLMEYLCIDAAQQKVMFTGKGSSTAKRSKLFNATGKPGILEKILTEIAPASALWNMQYHCVRWMIKQVPFTNELLSYTERIIAEQSSRFVAASAVYGLAQRYEADKNVDEFARAYTRLLTDYPGIHPTNRAKAEYKLMSKLQPGNMVPDFSIASLDNPGENITPASFKGRTYLIEFWALWCGGCIAAMPEMEKIQKKYRSDGFEILSVALESNSQGIKEFRRKIHPMPWKNGYDKNAFRSRIARDFEVSWVPRSVLVGPDGIILEIDPPANSLRDIIPLHLRKQKAATTDGK